MANQHNTDQEKKMSLEEAGRKGGQATSKKHDKHFYEKIGRKGGEARASQRIEKQSAVLKDTLH